MRQTFTESELNNLLPDSSFQELKTRFANANKGGRFTPILTTPTIVYPGYSGGAQWGGAAFDPATSFLYVNANETPNIITAQEVNSAIAKNETNLAAGQRLYTKYCTACHGHNRKGSGEFPSLIGVENRYDRKSFGELLASGRRMMPAFSNLSEQECSAVASFVLGMKTEQQKVFTRPQAEADPYKNLPYTIDGYQKFISNEGCPGIKPLWGTLNAVNLSTGEIAWRIPLGEYAEFKKKGIVTGTENYGGPVVTKTGLVFIAATRDGKFREVDLPAPGFATPSIYQVKGKEFVVIACGGSKLNTKAGDACVAFALF